MPQTKASLIVLIEPSAGLRFTPQRAVKSNYTLTLPFFPSTLKLKSSRKGNSSSMAVSFSMDHMMDLAVVEHPPSQSVLILKRNLAGQSTLDLLGYEWESSPQGSWDRNIIPPSCEAFWEDKNHDFCWSWTSIPE